MCFMNRKKDIYKALNKYMFILQKGSGKDGNFSMSKSKEGKTHLMYMW